MGTLLDCKLSMATCTRETEWWNEVLQLATNEAAASSTARCGHEGASAGTDRWEVLEEETTAATDRWDILVRRLYCCRTKRAS